MRLKGLSVESMLGITRAWLDPAGADREVLASDPAVRALLPKLQAAHDALVQTQPRAGEGAASEEALKAEAAALDGQHDRKARGLFWVLQGLAQLADDAAAKGQWERVEEVLFPEGLSVVRRAYRDEAGAAEALAHRVTASTRQALDAVQVEGRGLTAHLDQWLEAARRLGEVQTARDRLGVSQDTTRVSAAEAHAAALRWARTVKGLLSVLALSEEIQAPARDKLLSSLRAAEAAARGR